MKPDVPVALQKLAGALLVEVAPAVGVDYLQRNTGITAIMLQLASEEWERAAARRVEENGAVRTLFREAAPVVADAALRARLEAAGAGTDADFRISALEAANASLRALLTELHAHVESLASPEARRIDDAIWAELRRSTERRAISLSPF
jgi:hypothetical protein